MRDDFGLVICYKLCEDILKKAGYRMFRHIDWFVVVSGFDKRFA
jgi:hypothetical protein